MGIILYTEDGDELSDHEGYLAHVLDDGSATSTWTVEIERRTVGWSADCSCGWAGPVYDSRGPQTPTGEQEDAILGDWEAKHAGPVRSLAGLGALAKKEIMATDNLRAGVSMARASGVTWEQIGRALGVRRQAAWERFSSAERAQSCPPEPGAGTSHQPAPARLQAAFDDEVSRVRGRSR